MREQDYLQNDLKMGSVLRFIDLVKAPDGRVGILHLYQPYVTEIRSEALNILASHEIQSEHNVKLPKGFAPVNCDFLDVAAIAKIESKNRIFLIMGAI